MGREEAVGFAKGGEGVSGELEEASRPQAWRFRDSEPFGKLRSWIDSLPATRPMRSLSVCVRSSKDAALTRF
jgi:hypothetical protein